MENLPHQQKFSPFFANFSNSCFTISLSLSLSPQGGTPLHYYVWADAVKKEKTDILVSLLTTAEVEVDCRTDDGNTPLHLAVKVE